MIDAVVRAYRKLENVRPLVRPAYNQFEISLLPPYGDPEVHVPGEIGSYVVVGLIVTTVTELLYDE